VSSRYQDMAERLGIDTHLHALRHYSATELQMSGIALDASFGKIYERRLPALQRTDRSARSRAQAAAKGA
jgi:hypothetical protein